jgi:hypothetical protein
MKPRAKVFLALLIFLLSALFPIMADGAVISIDSVIANPGTNFTASVRLTDNNHSISALTVPLKFGSPYLSVDSVSFAGTILPASFSGEAEINNTNKTVRISYSPNPSENPIPILSSSQGLISTIFFSVAQTATAGTVPIDSIIKDSIVLLGGNNIHYWTRVEFSDQSGTVLYLPTFNAGSVDIQLSTGIEDDNGGLLPDKFDIAQNYPNPFNPSTTIEYSLARSGEISIKVYNVIGQEVATLAEGRKSAGVYSLTFNAANLPSGVYFYKYVHPEGAQTRKLLLVK